MFEGDLAVDDDMISLLNIQKAERLVKVAHVQKLGEFDGDGGGNDSMAMNLIEAGHKIRDALVFESNQLVKTHLNSLADAITAIIERSRNAALLPTANTHPTSTEQTVEDEDGWELVAVEPTVSFDDLAGCEALRRTLTELFVLPSRFPELFTGALRAGCQAALLYGPPGTGKTAIVHALAQETGRRLYPVSAGQIMSRWVGAGESRVRAAFIQAATAPSIVFLDEVDALGRDRGSDGDAAGRRVLVELLTQLNSVPPTVIVIAATNRLADVDPALVRRFHRTIELPLPTPPQIAAVTRHLLKEVDHTVTDAAIDRLAGGVAAAGGNIALIYSICKEAAMGPLRGFLEATGVEVTEVGPVTDVMLADAARGLGVEDGE